MGYKGTLQIEEDVLRILKNHPKITADSIANMLGASENHVNQAVSYLRKNVLKPNEAIVTHLKKCKTSGKHCTYELIVQTTARNDVVMQLKKVSKTAIRHIREISKLNLVLLYTTNPKEVQAIKMQINNLMTKLSKEMNMATLGITPSTNDTGI